jgi:hypothetical protein
VTLYTAVFPFPDIPAVMIERQPVPVAIIQVTIFTIKREIDTFAADRTGLVQGIFLFPEERGKKAADPISQSHTHLFAVPCEKRTPVWPGYILPVRKGRICPLHFPVHPAFRFLLCPGNTDRRSGIIIFSG